MKRLLLIILIICVIFVMTDTIAKKELDAKDCKCCIMVECYYPGYQSGVDLPFASKIVYSCAEAKEFMNYMSETVEYPDDWMEVPKYSAPVFFFVYPAKP